jgi:UDP-galactopyranose mutase
LRPNWSFVIVGPVVKIADEDLPRRPNIHYLGSKTHDQLPDYLAGWDVALMPFRLDKSTQFISPTKTPEYLAAGLPVVSTAVEDVVEPYGRLKLVTIARSTEEFLAALDASMSPPLDVVDEFLEQKSWDSVWSNMESHII